MSLPREIHQWLNDRGITDEVISTNDLKWEYNHLIIPVYNPDGDFMFNKYRRDPFGPTDVPKYKYDAGSTAQLFNAHKIPQVPTVIICEGEMDALRLEAEGIVAVSSTGGAGTFKDEWIFLLTGKNVYICYDNDEAGIKGAVKLLTKMPAKLVVIPREEGVKDITDFSQKHHFQDFYDLLDKAREYPILSEPVPEFKLQKEIRTQNKKFKYALEHLLMEERSANNSGGTTYHYDCLRQLLLNAIDNLKRESRRLRYFKNPEDSRSGNGGQITKEDIMRAKEIPISTFYEGKLHKTGNKMTGKCPFHNEENSSFTIFVNQNKFYCFGCSAGTDVIDFIQKKEGVSFIEAVKRLLNK